MRISEAMTPNVCIVNPSETVQMAAEAMATQGIGLLPVGENDRLVGMITDRDIAVRAVAKGRGPDTPVGEAMTEEVRYCFEDDELEDICRNMADLQVRRLPVLDRDKRLVGIIALGDVARETWDSAGQALSSISRPGGQHTQI